MSTTPARSEAPVEDRGRSEDEIARAEISARLRRGRLVTAAVAGVLVVLVGVVALLGGFRERTDLLTPVAAGTVISTGPYEVTLDKATVRHITDGDKWEVAASGTARTTGEASISPGTGSAGFVVARSESTREVLESDRVEIGGPDASDQQDNLTPGLPPVPWSVTFEFTRDPGTALFVGVFQQEYTTPWILSSEEGWRATNKGSTMVLPVTRLADQEF